MSPIIEAMKPSPNSDRQSCASLGELFPKNGTAFATESPTTFVSSRPTIFGSSRRPGIASLFSCGTTRLHCRYSSDANAGALHLKATIDPDEDRGQCLGGDGIGERSAVDTPRARRIRQVDHDRARVFVVSEHEHVAIDAFAGFELGCADIVERGLHASCFAKQS